MKYEINQFRWDYENGVKFFHLSNSKEFEIDKNMPEYSYSKNGSYFTIRRVDDEVQTKQRIRKRRNAKST